MVIWISFDTGLLDRIGCSLCYLFYLVVSFSISNMSGLLDYSTNQWSWLSLTGLRSENLHLGPLIPGVWVRTELDFCFGVYGQFFWKTYFSPDILLFHGRTHLSLMVVTFWHNIIVFLFWRGWGIVPS